MTRRLGFVIAVLVLTAGAAACHRGPATPPPDAFHMPAVQSGPARRVLLLYADRVETPFAQVFDRGVRAALSAGPSENLQVYAEYLDVSRFPGEAYLQDKAAFLRRRYAAVKPDVVVAAGWPAADFLLRFDTGLYPITPVVLFAERQRIATWPLPVGATAVAPVLQTASIIDLVLTLHPDARRLVLVAGSADRDRFWAAAATREIRARAPSIEILDLGTLPMREMLRQVSSQPPRTVLLHVSVFRDGAGQTFIPGAVVDAVARVANAPAYSNFDTVVGRGVVGGHVFSYERMGQQAASIVNRILRGEPVDSIPVIDEGAYVYMFDWRQLRRWSIDERRLPAGSVVRFREPTVWEQWKWYLLGGVTLFAVQSALIMWLLVHRAARRRAQQALTDQLRFEALLSELSATLVAAHGEAIDREIDTVLGRVGEELQVDEAALAQWDAGAGILRTMHAWTRADVEPIPASVDARTFPWFADRLRGGNVVALRSLDELPVEAAADRQNVATTGIRSVAVVPLTIGSGVAGAFWLDTRRAERAWPEELVQRLRLLGEMLANALARRSVERALRESEERFRAMADTAPVLIWMAERDRGRTFFNTAWLGFTGRTLQQELEGGWAQDVHADDFGACFEPYIAAFDARREFTLEYRLRRRDGRYRLVLDHGVPRFAGDGTFVGYIGCAYDVTDLKQAEERPRQMLEAAPNAMLMVTEEGMIAFANAAAETVFGHTRAELFGRPVAMLIPSGWRDGLRLQRTTDAAEPAARGIGMGRELYGRHKDGRDVPVEIGLTPIETPEGLFVLASVVDISERKEAELQAQQHRAELAHVTRIATMGELAASLAHELNQPLTAILSNAQAAQRFLDSDPTNVKEVQAILADIVGDNSRAGEVIHRLRALVRKEALDTALLDVGGVIRDVFVLIRSDAILRGSRLSLELDAGLPPVRGDRVQLQQVILNLLLNAFDAMKDVPADQREVLVRAEVDGAGMVRVAVRDRGMGIGGHGDQVFEPFFSTKSDGLGMGLSISRSIVQAHQGRLWGENNPDGGATFSFALPACRG